VADSNEALGQDVEEKAAQELRSRKRHLPLLAAVRIVLPAERYTLAIKSQQPMAGNSDSMRVSTQVTEELGWTSESRLGVDHPVWPM
jgi:hypothetical protein